MLVTVAFLGISALTLPNPTPIDLQSPLDILFLNNKSEEVDRSEVIPLDVTSQIQFERPLHLLLLTERQLDPKMIAGLQGKR